MTEREEAMPGNAEGSSEHQQHGRAGDVLRQVGRGELPVIPEPAGLGALLAGAGLLVTRRRR